MAEKEKKIIKQLFISASIVTIFGIFAIVFALCTLRLNSDLKEQIKEKDKEIQYLNNEVDRHKMISSDYEGLFQDCITGGFHE